jgi:hypothetical protein
MFDQPIWCSKCYLRIAPFEPHRSFRKRYYHQHCLLKVRFGGDSKAKREARHDPS